jgi:hypothetical protein
VPSLTRGRVCNLQCNRWEVRSLRTNNHTLPSHLRLCSLFVASYESQGLRWRYPNPPPHGVVNIWTEQVWLISRYVLSRLLSVSKKKHRRAECEQGTSRTPVHPRRYFIRHESHTWRHPGLKARVRIEKVGPAWVPIARAASNTRLPVQRTVRPRGNIMRILDWEGLLTEGEQSTCCHALTSSSSYTVERIIARYTGTSSIIRKDTPQIPTPRTEILSRKKGSCYICDRP